jgi:di/tricarboxylate transporter
MEWQAWLTLAVLGAMVVGMAREIAAPDLIVMAGLFTLASAGVLTPAETFVGFSNTAVATIAALFVVSAGLRETGALEATVVRLFARSRAEVGALVRMCTPLAAISAFLNNAPIVAMMTPVVLDWSRQRGLSSSRFLMPMAHATVLGSLTTMIGTSVNLTVAALMIDAGMPEMGFFELLPVGLPVAIVGLLYLVLIAPRLLPIRQELAEQIGEHRREYTATMRVQPGCRLIAQSVEAAGLRQLTGLYLVEIDRGGRSLTPVGPDELILEGDRLVFAGVVSTILDLQRIPGLVAVTAEEEAAHPVEGRGLMEAVVSPSSPMLYQTIRDANFRTVYDAAVIAVHRNGERVTGKIGDIQLRAGDTLLLQAAAGFQRAHRNSPDFYLVSEVAGPPSGRPGRAWLAIGILVAMVLSVVSGLMPIAIAAFLAAGALIITRCITGPAARRSVEWQVLIVIAAGLGIALAMEKSGAAAAVARLVADTAGSYGPLATLAVVYAVTVLLSELLHHNASVAMMFPVAVAAAAQVGADPRGFAMAVALAGNCAFANPTTYQTHLIVYGPGGYRFNDFVRVGLPLNLLCAAIVLLLVPRVWPF